MDCGGLQWAAAEAFSFQIFSDAFSFRTSWIWQDRLRTLLPDDPEGEQEQQEKEALSARKMDPILG